MKFLSLHLNNFRQFKGEHEIIFDENNVTVILGQNGHGKTSILRAILFCLFGQTHLKRDSNEQNINNNILVNKNLIEESDNFVSGSVKLKFVDNDIQYELQRTILCMKNNEDYITRNGEVILSKTSAGNTAIIRDKDEIRINIDRIISEQYKDFFLFDGEQMEAITEQTSQAMENIKNSIIKFLNLDVLTVTKNVIDRLIKDTSKDIRDFSRDAELESLADEICKIQKEAESYDIKYNELESALSINNDELSKYNKLLRDIRNLIVTSKTEEKREDAYKMLIKLIEDYNVKLLSTKVYWEDPKERENYKKFWKEYSKEQDSDKKEILSLKRELSQVDDSTDRNKKLREFYKHKLVEFGVMKNLKNSAITGNKNKYKKLKVA